MKLHEIANSLVDAVTTMPMLTQTSKWDQESRPSSLLSHLHSLLSAFTDGGNNALVDMLYRKMAHAHSVVSSTIPPLLTCIRPVQNRNCESQSTSRVQGTLSTTWEGGSSANDAACTNAANWLRDEGAPGGSGHEVNQTSPWAPDGTTDAATASVPLDFTDQQLGNPWSYLQSSYDPLMYPPPQDFGTNASGLSIPATSGSLDIRSLDTVLNNVIFDTSHNQLPLGPYFPIANVPGDGHPQVNI